MRLLLIFTLIISFLKITPVVHAEEDSKGKVKIGLTRTTMGISYTYETQRFDDASSTSAEKEVTATSVGEVQTTEFMLEWVVLGVVGFEVVTGFTTGIRHFTFETLDSSNSSIKIGDIAQSLNTTALVGLNMYPFNHQSNGIKPFLGIQTGTLTLISDYKNGGERNDDQEEKLAGFRAKQTSTLAVPVQVMKVGFDSILEGAGLRIQYLYMTGEVISTSSLKPTLISVPQAQKETAILTGGVSIGIFTYW
ncbi:hypothetical protein WDW89_08925 [Deltaproteobacteria bacterium TL4]